MFKPEICRITPFEGGETVQIYGENFTNESKLYWWRKNVKEDADIASCGTPNSAKLPPTPPKDAKCFKIRNVVNGQVAYLGPEDGVPAGTAVYWIENEEGISAPFIGNEPKVWSQSVLRSLAGGIVSLYGDCMWSTNNKHAYLKNIKTGEYTEAQVVAAKAPMYYFGLHRHRTNIIVPDLHDGEYEVYMHNGTGSEFGWSNPVKITLESDYTLTEYFRTKWNRDAKKSFAFPHCEIILVNANPLGAIYDITDELQSALDKAANSGGGIVMLSSGTFGISKTLALRDGVVLMGAGEGATLIKAAEGCIFCSDWSDVSYAARANGEKHWAIDWKPHWDKYNHCPLIRLYNDAGIEGVKFELGGGANIGVIIANSNEQAHSFGCFVNNVTVDGAGLYSYEDKGFGAMSAGIVSTCSNTELSVYKSTFIAMIPVYMMPANNYYVRFINNVFRCAPRNYDESFMNGMHYSIFIENDFIDGRRSFMSQAGFDNNFVYQNRSSGVSRGCNANEVYMSEHGECEWGGYAESIGKDYISVSRKSGLFNTLEKEGTEGERNGIYGQSMGALTNEHLKEYRYWLCILKGRGFGQYREVTKIEENRLILDKPWDIMPDATTAFTLVSGTVNNIWLDNNSELSNSHSQFIWNCGIENVITGHEISMSAGIRLYSNCYYTRSDATCVLAFNRIVHCMVRGSGKGLWLNSDGFRIEDRPDYVRYTGGGIFGNSVRACVFDGGRSMPYIKNLPHTMTDSNPHCGVAVGGGFNTFCRNRIGGYVTAVSLLDNCDGNCFDTNYYWDNCSNFAGNTKAIGNDFGADRIKRN